MSDNDTAPQASRHCRHYDWRLIDSTGACRAGVNPVAEFCRGVRFGWATRAPCFECNAAAPACARREFPSHEELAADAAFTVELMHAAEAVCAMLPPASTGVDTGVVPCPLCGQAVTWSRAPNGHRAARCATRDCLTFME